MSNTAHNNAPKSGSFSGSIGSLEIKSDNASMAIAGDTLQFNVIHHRKLDDTYSFLHCVLLSETPPGKHEYSEDEKKLLRLNYSESNPRDRLRAEITKGTFEVITDKSGRYILSLDVTLGLVNTIKVVGKFEFN